MRPAVRERLARLALGYGAWHGDAVSAAQMIERLILETPDPLDGVECGEAIATLLHEQQAFRLTYRSARGNERVYEVCGGRILALPQGGMLLAVVPVPPEGRENDSPELPMNWLLRLDRITAIESIDARWVDIPRALATFTLAPAVAVGYQPHPDDQGTEQQADGSLIVRRWYSHRWPMRQMLLSLGGAAELLSPAPFREAIAAETAAAAARYNPAMGTGTTDT